MGKANFINNKNNRYFIKNYQIVMTTIGFENQQTICINDNNETCRFCGRTKSEVKFNNKSHAIPEAFGNKQVITKNECNECNQKYANSIENDLLNLTLPIRNITAVSGKRGIPKYKDVKTSNSCEYKEGIYQINNYDDFLKIEEENKKIILKFNTPAMYPLKAYKALVRIALNCLPKEYF
ncbi:MAG: HNH endonuclease, partial [Clostridia bacterium]|nr:HNH endonuclease [Clostridia bacterium]